MSGVVYQVPAMSRKQIREVANTVRKINKAIFAHPLEKVKISNI